MLQSGTDPESYILQYTKILLQYTSILQYAKIMTSADRKQDDSPRQPNDEQRRVAGRQH